jgi:putative oxidoreductase
MDSKSFSDFSEGWGTARMPPCFPSCEFAGVIECFGGLLIILGLFTRPVAFLLCGEMAVAYFKQHAVRGLWPISNGGELAVIYCFVFLYLVHAGAGPLSLDRAVRKKS